VVAVEHAQIPPGGLGQASHGGQVAHHVAAPVLHEREHAYAALDLAQALDLLGVEDEVAVVLLYYFAILAHPADEV
jgi:hypothetical protein